MTQFGGEMHPNSTESRERNRIMSLAKAAQILPPRSLELEAFFRLLDRDDKIMFLEMRKEFHGAKTHYQTNASGATLR